MFILKDLHLTLMIKFLKFNMLLTISFFCLRSDPGIGERNFSFI
jgi:hypothetical protein